MRGLIEQCRALGFVGVGGGRWDSHSLERAREEAVACCDHHLSMVNMSETKQDFNINCNKVSSWRGVRVGLMFDVRH